MAGATCLFIGAVPLARDQRRMAISLQNDFEQMIAFASEGSTRQRGQFYHPVRISKILVNNSETGHRFEREVCGAFGQGTKERNQIQARNWLHYDDKGQVRDEVREFLQESPTESLILFMTGHGFRKTEGDVEESFVIPTPYGNDFYTDKELTQDIERNLAAHSKLYIVINACHSGGMLNRWEIGIQTKWVALFASAEADEASEYIADSLSQTYIKVFRKWAKPGLKLANIAADIQKDLYESKSPILPAFVLTRPDIALDNFL